MAVGIERKSSIGYGIESTEGTRVAATASEMFLAYDVSIEGINPEMIDRMYLDDTFGERSPVPGVKKPKISFTTPIRVHGDISTDSALSFEVSELWKTIMGTEDKTDVGADVYTGSSTTTIQLENITGGEITQYHAVGLLSGDSSEFELGWVSTLDTGADTIEIYPAVSNAPSTDDRVYPTTMYKLANTGHQSLSFDFYDSDIAVHQYVGCKGTVTIEGAVGQIPMAKWAFMGMDVTSTNDTDGPAFTPSYDSAVERVIKNARIFIDTTQVVVENITIDINNAVTERPDQNGSQGLAGYAITNREVTVSMTGIEASDVSYISNLAGSTSAEVFIQWGNAKGYTFGAWLPTVYWTNTPLSTSDGKRIYELQGKAIKSSGNDELYLAFA